MNEQHPRFLTISWIALAAAIVIPPVGIILGIIAMSRSKKLPDRPGNRAVAISSILTALFMILILVPMIGWFFIQHDEAYDEMRRVEEEMYMEQEHMKEKMQTEMEAMERAMREAEEAMRQAEQAPKAMEQ